MSKGLALAKLATCSSAETGLSVVSLSKYRDFGVYSMKYLEVGRMRPSMRQNAKQMLFAVFLSSLFEIRF